MRQCLTLAKLGYGPAPEWLDEPLVTLRRWIDAANESEKEISDKREEARKKAQAKSKRRR